MTTPTTTAPASVTLRLQAVLLAAADELTPDLLQPEPGGPCEDELDEELQLADDLGFDSVMLMSLKASLEEHFPELGGLSMPEVLPSLHTVGTLLEYLNRRLAPAGAA
ncbi:phosphopantetheine-binding protein [Kitasatospora sp. NBC_00085]|uniref:acyl carrier protein n=1 Tax=unclassified Kitasatospora TaxID=2633591 RepID=UPI0032553A88